MVFFAALQISQVNFISHLLISFVTSKSDTVLTLCFLLFRLNHQVRSGRSFYPMTHIRSHSSPKFIMKSCLLIAHHLLKSRLFGNRNWVYIWEMTGGTLLLGKFTLAQPVLTSHLYSLKLCLESIIPKLDCHKSTPESQTFVANVTLHLAI